MSGPVRVYLPATLASLAGLLDGGRLDPGIAYAVTRRLRDTLAVPSLAPDDGVDDELAEAALVAAADASLDLLAGDPGAPRRRVVVAADLAVTDAGPDDHPAAVRPPDAVELSDVACLLVDDVDATAAVEAVLSSRDATPDRYEAALDALDGHTLAWFDVSELPDLVPHTPESQQEGGRRGR